MIFNISAKKLRNGELLILVSNHKVTDVFDQYRIRWEIETLFSALKTRGFDLEAKHITKPERLSNLFFVVTIAFIWAYRQGDLILMYKPIKLKKHGYPQHSIIRQGLNVITKSISEIVCTGVLTKYKKYIKFSSTINNLHLNYFQNGFSQHRFGKT